MLLKDLYIVELSLIDIVPIVIIHSTCLVLCAIKDLLIGTLHVNNWLLLVQNLRIFLEALAIGGDSVLVHKEYLLLVCRKSLLIDIAALNKVPLSLEIVEIFVFIVKLYGVIVIECLINDNNLRH